MGIFGSALAGALVVSAGASAAVLPAGTMGHINQAIVTGQDVGKLIKPVLHRGGQGSTSVIPVKELALSPETLEAYVGKYRLTPRLTFTITRDGKQLMAQLTGQPSLPVFADKPDHFFYEVVDAQLDFARDASGKVTSLTLHQNGHDMKAPRMADGNSGGK